MFTSVNMRETKRPLERGLELGFKRVTEGKAKVDAR